MFLIRWGWGLLAVIIYRCAPRAFEGWEWVGFFTTCLWIGELGYRWMTGWIVGEFIEEREGAQTKRVIRDRALQDELREARRELAIRDRAHRKLTDLEYRLTETNKSLRQARQHIDRMTDHFGPMRHQK